MDYVRQTRYIVDEVDDQGSVLRVFLRSPVSEASKA
jgi:hypothetical protein